MGFAALNHPTASRRVLAAAIAGLIVLFAFVADAAEALGRYEGVLGNAPYLINVPPDWNGGLVLFAHGYQGEGAGRGMAQPEPLGNHLTERGYAWAASGYRAWGYRPDWFLLDMLALRAHFINASARRAGRLSTASRWAGMSASPRSNCTRRRTKGR
jgi:hypothetical protein